MLENFKKILTSTLPQTYDRDHFLIWELVELVFLRDYGRGWGGWRVGRVNF